MSLALQLPDRNQRGSREIIIQKLRNFIQTEAVQVKKLNLLVKNVQSSKKKPEAIEVDIQRTSAPEAKKNAGYRWQCSILNPELRWGVLKPHFKV